MFLSNFEGTPRNDAIFSPQNNFSTYRSIVSTLRLVVQPDEALAAAAPGLPFLVRDQARIPKRRNPP